MRCSEKYTTLWWQYSTCRFSGPILAVSESASHCYCSWESLMETRLPNNTDIKIAIICVKAHCTPSRYPLTVAKEKCTDNRVLWQLLATDTPKKLYKAIWCSQNDHLTASNARGHRKNRNEWEIMNFSCTSYQFMWSEYPWTYTLHPICLVYLKETGCVVYHWY